MSITSRRAAERSAAPPPWGRVAVLIVINANSRLLRREADTPTALTVFADLAAY
jgi:hypothetical protein